MNKAAYQQCNVENISRNILGLKERIEVIKDSELYSARTRIAELACKYNVSQSQIRNILQSKEIIKRAYEFTFLKNSQPPAVENKTQNVTHSESKLPMIKSESKTVNGNAQEDDKDEHKHTNEKKAVCSIDLRITNCLSIKERFNVIKQYIFKQPKPLIKDLAKKHHVHRAQIRRILQKQVAIVKAYEAQCKKEISKRKTLVGEDDSFQDSKDLRFINYTKAIHEYWYKQPRPTLCSLAAKYSMSRQAIVDTLKRHALIPKPKMKSITSAKTIEERNNERRRQYKFLNKVMYEYLQRALWHNVPLDDMRFQRKAAEVRKCMALHSFMPKNEWLKDFKKKYGIDNIRSKTLRTDLNVTEEKPPHMDAADLIRSQIEALQMSDNKERYKNTYVYKRKDSTKVKTFEDIAESSHKFCDYDAKEALVNIDIEPTQTSENHTLVQIISKDSIKVLGDPNTVKNKRRRCSKTKNFKSSSDKKKTNKLSTIQPTNQMDETLNNYEDHTTNSHLLTSNSPDFSTISDSINKNSWLFDNDKNGQHVEPIENQIFSYNSQQVHKSSSEHDLIEIIVIKTECSDNESNPENCQIFKDCTTENACDSHEEWNASEILNYANREKFVEFKESSATEFHVADIKEDINSVEIKKESNLDDIDNQQIALSRLSRHSSPLPEILGIKLEFIPEEPENIRDQQQALPNSSQLVISNAKEAQQILEVLENYALYKGKYKAIGLLAHLEDVFKETKP